MADLLLDLIQVLKSKEGQDKITRQEVDYFNSCKSQAIKGFAVGCSIATGLVWVASRKLNNFLRFNLIGGAGFVTGMWRFEKSVDSCIDHILSMDGSRMQHELRKIVLEKYGNNPQRMQLFSRHFYSEEVISDSTHEHVKSVYRHRNVYRDDERTTDSKTYETLHANRDDVYCPQSNGESSSFKLKKPAVGIRQARIHPSINMEEYGDPLEVLFGLSMENESYPLDDSANMAKLQSRSQRRANRRHRMHHRHGVSSSLEEA